MFYKSHSKSRAWFRQKIKETMKEEFPSFNIRQKAKVASTVFDAATSGLSDEEILDKLFTVVYKCERRQDSKKKIATVKGTVTDNATEHGYPLIFYLCSRHSNCAEDHKDYEGRLYYDRFWRTKYKNQPEWLIKKIEKFINDNHLLAVQYISTAPVWLTTRPYCKHFFTRIDTLTALTSKPEPPVTHGKATRRGQSKKDIRKRLGI